MAQAPFSPMMMDAVRAPSSSAIMGQDSVDSVIHGGRNRSNVPGPMKYHSIGECSGNGMEIVTEDASSSTENFQSCGISAKALAQYSNELDSKFMVLDVRPFGAFHRGHIQSALSVGCSAMLQRRLARGKSRVRDLVADDQRSRFVEMQRSSIVVVYDDRASSLMCVESNPLYIFLLALRREGVNVVYLEGGYQQFSVQFPTLCKNFKNSGQSSLTLQVLWVSLTHHVFACFMPASIVHTHMSFLCYTKPSRVACTDCARPLIVGMFVVGCFRCSYPCHPLGRCQNPAYLAVPRILADRTSVLVHRVLPTTNVARRIYRNPLPLLYRIFCLGHAKMRRIPTFCGTQA